MIDHIPAATLAAYSAGEPQLDDATVWVVEVHLESCGHCRSTLAGQAAPDLLGLLDDVQVRIDRGVRTGPRPARGHAWRRLVHRWAAWAIVPWAALVVTVVLAAFLLDRAYPERPSLVLLLAPVAPLAGLAVTWSRRTDAAAEVIAGTARAGLELLLRRTVVVLVLILPPLAVAGWCLGMSPARWLLPCLTFTAATLLLGGRIGVTMAAAVLGIGWLTVVIVPAMLTARLPVLVQAASLPGWLAAAVIFTALMIWRADDHQRLESWR
ncbi:integral membrane protein [Actinoplanes sp. N902-109]|uniref:integral membrane protein n=1 Tax=Actinoplanes sp. (strain N902-109) TaxID=649831 RepID=UPI000329422D|nr:integral membrane protein [Actinoplanes sp. N902-109]AGL14120.1 integral membrane protein [Actinoplanes sp. N902-109]